MIKICVRTHSEVESINRQYKIMGIAKKIGTFYINNNGIKTEIEELTEAKIMEFISSDLKDFYNPNGSYKRDFRIDLDSFKLINLINLTPSYDSIIIMLEWERLYGHIASELQEAFGIKNIIDEARIIARFLKESNGNFNPVDINDIIRIIKQMRNNDKLKERITKQK